jgi:hypothetical protein
MGDAMTFRDAVLHDAGEETWIDVEVVAYAARNPHLAEDIRTKSGVSGRSHSLNNPYDEPWVLAHGTWRRELTRYESWVVMDALSGLAAVQRAVRKGQAR